MTPEEVAALKPGLYVISWKDGGMDTLTAIGHSTHNPPGRWFAATNWDGAIMPGDRNWYRIVESVAAASPIDVWNRRAAATEESRFERTPKKPKAWPRRRLLALAVVERLRDMCADGVATIPTVAVRRLRDDLVLVANLGYEKPHIEPTIVQAYGGPT